MLKKELIRKKVYLIRKKNYFPISDNFFSPLIKLISKKYQKKSISLSLYYPTNSEVNVLNFFNSRNKNIKTLLPIVMSNNNLKFVEWNLYDPLKVNKYGMLEPNIQKRSIIPNVMFVPLLAYDQENNRIGYGKGYYDKFLNKYLKIKKNILTIGIAFSFQKYNKLPSSNLDVKLDYILTEKGLQKK